MLLFLLALAWFHYSHFPYIVLCIIYHSLLLRTMLGRTRSQQQLNRKARPDTEPLTAMFGRGMSPELQPQSPSLDVAAIIIPVILTLRNTQEVHSLFGITTLIASGPRDG